MHIDTPKAGLCSSKAHHPSKGTTRRRFLVVGAGLAGLHVSTSVAKRRGGRQGRKRGQRSVGAESRSRAVTIELVRLRDAAGTTLSATFSATGAIDDVGTFTVEDVHIGAIGALTFGHVQTVNRLVSEDGTFIVQETHKVIPTDDPNVYTVEGTWVVRGGTAGYARLHGQGTTNGLIDERGDPDRFAFTLTGTVHFD